MAEFPDGRWEQYVIWHDLFCWSCTTGHPDRCQDAYIADARRRVAEGEGEVRYVYDSDSARSTEAAT